MKVFLLFVLAFCFCINVSSSSNKQSILVRDTHFQITGDEDARTYYYKVINNNGETVDSGHVERLAPTIRYLSDDIIEICFHGGTYADLCKYYSISQDRFSDSFGIHI